jgi:hypothetical protein
VCPRRLSKVGATKARRYLLSLAPGDRIVNVLFLDNGALLVESAAIVISLKFHYLKKE